jgi:hypothetical protein
MREIPQTGWQQPGAFEKDSELARRNSACQASNLAIEPGSTA